MKILLLDNYDSFTFNLYHYLSSLKCKVDVVRNDKINSKEILNKKYNKIVISPGPGNPSQAGNCLDIVKKLHKKIPILETFPVSFLPRSNNIKCSEISFWSFNKSFL